jgi:hypothetical protein
MSAQAALKAFPVPVVRAENRIPHGAYCYAAKRESYFPVTPCVYWKLRADHPSQMNGWCDYLATGDMMEDGTSLLWDQVKECGIKEEDALEY